MIDPIVKPKLNRYRKELGLSPASRIFHEWIHSPALTVCAFPQWFAAPQPDWPISIRQTTFPLFDDVFANALHDETQQFLEQGSPPVVFTPGTANKFAAKFFEEGAKACQISGRRGLFLTQYPEQLPSALPNGVQHCSYVPLSLLLPHCTTLVHHGGIGTCAQALKARIPQIIQPLNFDQFDNGERIIRLGVGQTISPRDYCATNIAKSLDDLLHSPSVKIQCAAAGDSFTGMDPLAETCEVIESHFPTQ